MDDTRISKLDSPFVDGPALDRPFLSEELFAPRETEHAARLAALANASEFQGALAPSEALSTASLDLERWQATDEATEDETLYRVRRFRVVDTADKSLAGVKYAVYQ